MRVGAISRQSRGRPLQTTWGGCRKLEELEAAIRKLRVGTNSRRSGGTILSRTHARTRLERLLKQQRRSVMPNTNNAYTHATPLRRAAACHANCDGLTAAPQVATAGQMERPAHSRSSQTSGCALATTRPGQRRPLDISHSLSESSLLTASASLRGLVSNNFNLSFSSTG